MKYSIIEKVSSEQNLIWIKYQRLRKRSMSQIINKLYILVLYLVQKS